MTSPRTDLDPFAPADRSWFEVTLESIGDAVIATDRDARVRFMNPTAERLTGWTRTEAAGRALEEIFRIFNEQTRAAVESPVRRAIREGAVVGLANHTLLVARDGEEYPIDDSAAPIRGEGGDVLGVVLVFHDITQRRLAEEEHERLAALVMNSDDAIISKTLQGVITSWNPAAQRMLGYTAEEAIGKPITMLIPQERHFEEDHILARLRVGERIFHYETVRRTKDGRDLDVSISTSPIRDGSGRILGAAKIMRDIRERKIVEAQREALLAKEQEARVAAESANREKDAFLATLSHELRTPLSAALGWATLLRQKFAGPDEEMREGLEVIERSCRSQARLIEDMLDVARIASGKLKLELRPYQLATAVTAALEMVRPQAQAKSVALEHRLDPEVGEGLGDPARMQQVVSNLLTNAIKFTPRGGTVRVSLERSGDDAVVEVADTGQGIDPEILPNLFERFWQGDTSTKRRFGGLGLGLSIVKHITVLHGGAVRAESAGHGKGATFTVRVPIRAGAQPPPSPPRIDPASGDSGAPRLDGVRVLVVDDEPDARRLQSKLLELVGASVLVAASASEALRLLGREHFDVLVSDLGMPELDGYDLIAQIRAREDAARAIPALALTAFATKEDGRRALLAGFQVHLPKPVDPEELVHAVSRLAGPRP